MIVRRARPKVASVVSDVLAQPPGGQVERIAPGRRYVARGDPVLGV